MRSNSLNLGNRNYTRQGRGDVDDGPMPLQGGVIALVACAAIALSFSWSLDSLSLFEMGVLAGLVCLCVAPIYIWYRSGMKWIPFGEIFIFAHLIYYINPALMGREDWVVFPESQRILTLLALGLFLGSAWAAYSAVLHSSWLPLEQTELCQRKARPKFIWYMFGLWIAWSVLVQSGLVPHVENLLNVFRSTATAAGAIGIVYLLYQEGRGNLSRLQSMMTVGGLGLGLAVIFASGFLVGAAEIMVAALLAYSAGRRQIPVGAIVVSVALLGMLQLGKIEFRKTFWDKGSNSSEQRVGLLEGYNIWLSSAWENLTVDNNQQSSVHTQTIFERLSLIQVLATAMDTVPEKQPFLDGKTYWMLPELMMPRVFWPDKPRGTLASETVGIYCGVQTEKGADFTGKSVGSVVEAWVNFGWFGMVVAGAFLGGMFGFAARLTRVLAPIQVGWLLAAVVVTYCIKMELCIAEILCSLLQALLMALVLLVAFSDRPVKASNKRRVPAPVRPPVSR